MPGEWKVLVDKKTDNRKRFVKIEDVPNRRVYESFFPDTASDTAVKARLKTQVKQHRSEIASRANISTLDLTNFEAGL